MTTENYTKEYLQAVCGVLETILDSLDREDRKRVLIDLFTLYNELLR
jgi:hypothetical protein